MKSAELTQAVVLGLVAFVATLALVPLSIRLAKRLGAIDPPGPRRINTHPMPRLGGLAMFGGLLVAIALEVVGEFAFGWSGFYHNEGQLDINYLGVLSGLAVITLVGATDDVHQLTPALKLSGQIIAALIVVVAGVHLNEIKNPLAEGFVDLGWLSYPLTIIYLVAFVNIINIVDGLDGLAAGISAIAALALFTISLSRGHNEAALFAIMLLGICLAFLRYNFPPARTYMGDSGSHLIGMLLGTISLIGVMRSPIFIILLVPLLIAGVPVLDTSIAIIRRAAHKRPIHLGDTDHLHHMLLRQGIATRPAVLFIYAWTAALGISGIVITGAHFPVIVLILMLMAAISALILWRLGLFKAAARFLERSQSASQANKDNTDSDEPPDGDQTT